MAAAPRAAPPDTLRAPARRLLCQLSHFAYLTSDQAAALAACSPTTIAKGRRELADRGWLAAFTVTAVASRVSRGWPRTAIYTLTPLGRRAARDAGLRQPGASRPGLDRLDAMLAAADLAVALQSAGEGDWLPWAEYRHHGAQQRPDQPPGAPRWWQAHPRFVPPAGILATCGGPWIPIWVIIEAGRRADLQASIQLAFRRRELEPPRIYALPALCAGLRALATPVDVRSWTPPRLAHRPPLQPGWWRMAHPEQPLAADTRDALQPRGKAIPEPRKAPYPAGATGPGAGAAEPADGTTRGDPGPRAVVATAAGAGVTAGADARRPTSDRQPPTPAGWPESPAAQGDAGAALRSAPQRPGNPRLPRATARAEDLPRALGPRMLATLSFLDRFGHATVGQVTRAAGRRAPTIRATMAQLQAHGLAQRHGTRPTIWSATATGLAATGSARQPLPAKPNHHRHTLALVDLAHALQQTTGGTWETEREVRTAMGAQLGRHPVAPPDGRLTLADGCRVLIQLQLSAGATSTQYLSAWKQRYAGLGDAVWFVCVPSLAPAYRRLLTPGDARFVRVLAWTPPHPR